MSAPTDRGRRDQHGKRRPSTSMPRREGRGARLARRINAVGRFAAKRKSSLLILFGSLVTVLSLVLLEGAVQVVSVLLSLVIAGTGAAIRHHQKTQLMQRSPNVSTPTWRERRTMTNNGRGGNYFDGSPHQQASGPVTVTSHDRESGKVRQYTRARPGQGGGDAA